ncbi:hypothetical protein ABZ154_11130 [Streptomyces sp. NPDC006261]|uniref:hypothetical protein n=1 Tax=Streptomyces sp. NPDC006261 TaxID=3156739 RepID=UPI0033B352D5
MTIPLRIVEGDLRRAHEVRELRRHRTEYRRAFDRTAYADEVDLHQERQQALSAAAAGFDYPYSYPGDPFSRLHRSATRHA